MLVIISQEYFLVFEKKQYFTASGTGDCNIVPAGKIPLFKAGDISDWYSSKI